MSKKSKEQKEKARRGVPGEVDSLPLPLEGGSPPLPPPRKARKPGERSMKVRAIYLPDELMHRLEAYYLAELGRRQREGVTLSGYSIQNVYREAIERFVEEFEKGKKRRGGK